MLKSNTSLKKRENMNDEELLASLNYDLLIYATIEQKTRVENIITLITELKERLKMSLILPKMLESPKLVGQRLKGTKYENVLHWIHKFRKDKCEAEGVTIFDPEGIPALDLDTHNIIDFILEHHDIMQYLPNWLEDLSENEHKLLKWIDDLIYIATNRFVRSAKKDLDEEEQIHKIFHSNKQMQSDLTYLEAKVKSRRFSLLWKSAAKSGVIKKLEDELNFYKYDNRLRVNKQLSAMNNIYQKLRVTFNTKQKELEEAYQKAEQDFKKKIAADIVSEKAARDEKNKQLLQLQAIIKKYDEVMLQKFRESIELEEELEAVKRELDELMPIYYEEEARHYELVVKKEEEYRQEQEQMVLKFTQKRAAKLIQRWFRKILRERKKLEKAARPVKGKGKGAAPKGNKKEKRKSEKPKKT